MDKEIETKVNTAMFAIIIMAQMLVENGTLDPVAVHANLGIDTKRINEVTKC